MSYQRSGYSRRNGMRQIFILYTTKLSKQNLERISCYLFSSFFLSLSNYVHLSWFLSELNPTHHKTGRIPRCSWRSLSSLKGAASKQAPTTAAKSTWRYRERYRDIYCCQTLLGEWSWMPKKELYPNQNQIPMLDRWVIWGWIMLNLQTDVA